MASLTHVCVWSSKGWTHITPEEVARSHPGGSVSARSGLLCVNCADNMYDLLMVISRHRIFVIVHMKKAKLSGAYIWSGRKLYLCGW